MTFPPFSDSASLPTPSFPILFSATAEQEADSFAQTSLTARREAIYRRALARFAVNHYLQCLGIQTDLKSTEFIDDFRRSLMDIADIHLPNFGQIECCPVSPGEEQVRIPAEVWEGRIAYFAVEIDLEKRQAIILGFLKHIRPKVMEEQNSEVLPLHHFRGIDELPHFLATTQPLLIELRQWWENHFGEGWNSLDGLLQRNSRKLAGAYRSQAQAELKQKMQDFFGENSHTDSFHTSSHRQVAGYKLVPLQAASMDTVSPYPLSSTTQRNSVALVLHALQECENEFEFSIDAIPGPDQQYLPNRLKLALLDQHGSEILVACTQHHNRHLQLEFSGSSGDNIVIQLSLNGVNFEERIMI